MERMDKSARVAVLTGDLQTENDAQRLAKFGFPVKQIITGGTCHLDAKMIEQHLADWKLEDLDLLIVENVGNLVCPSSYDLGEDAKIVLLSTTEGEDKPLKYPSIFFKSELMVLTKIDLLPYVPFSRRNWRRRMRAACIRRWRSWKCPAPRAKVWMAGWNGCENASRRKPR